MVNRSGVGRIFARVKASVLLALIFAALGTLLWHDARTRTTPKLTPPATAQAQALFARLPVTFEPNQGQTDRQVKFLAHGTGYGVYLMPSRALLTLSEPSATGLRQVPLEMRLAGANDNAPIVASDRLPGHSSYFVGDDSSRWLRNIPQFGRVEYRDVYPGIDLAFYGNQNRLEYDFEVSPGRDARQIQLDFNGAEKLSVASNGDLVVVTGAREMRFQAPHIYQRSASGEKTVAGSFVLRGKNSAGFELGPYDRSRTLVIDPVFLFSSYLGGSGDESCPVITRATTGFVPHCPAVTVDSAGNIYVAGATTSPSPFAGATPNTIPSGATPNPALVFVARMSFSGSGSVLSFVTYVGGTGTQYPVGVGVDSGFNVYVAGNTNASNFPVTGSAYQSTPGSAAYHAFITQLDSTGSANLYSTYLSGNGTDAASDMTIDSLGRVYVVGTTSSTNFPVTIGALQSTPAGNGLANQLFFSKLNTGLNGSSSLLYSTYIGGNTPSGGSVTGGAISVDSKFDVYLAAGTSFSNMPVLNAYQTALKAPGATNIWAARLNAPTSNIQQYTVEYETYLGGSGSDIAHGVSNDGTSTYITGLTTSTDITVPSTTVSFQPCLDQPGITTCAAPSPVVSNAFVAKFGLPTTSGSTVGTVPLDYFTYLGGSGPAGAAAGQTSDVGLSIVADSLGNARVTGFTNSSNFPVNPSTSCPSSGPCNPLQTADPNASSSPHAFVARLSTTGSSTGGTSNLSGYLGGNATEQGTSLALDPSLNMYIAGETSSTDFPVQNPLPSTGGSLQGSTDAFVTVVGPNASGLFMPNPIPMNYLPATSTSTSPNPVVSPGTVGVGSPITFTYYIYNLGDPVPGVQFTDTPGAGSGSTTASTSQGSCPSSGVTTGTLTCTLGTVNSSTTTTTTSGSTTTTTVNYAAKVTVTVTAPVPSAPLTNPLSIGNSAAITPNPQGLPAAFGTAFVNDYLISAASTNATTQPSGASFTYTITVTPTGSGFPESVSLACGSGLPSGANCSFSRTPISNMSSGPQTSVLSVSTTARVTTTTGLLRRAPFYALWLPVLGIGLAGSGASRRRKTLLATFITALLALTLLQAGCSSSSSSTTTTGTPAGTYTVTVNATSGSATRTTTVQFTVQ